MSKDIFPNSESNEACPKPVIDCIMLSKLQKTDSLISYFSNPNISKA